MATCTVSIEKFIGFVELGIDFWEQAGKELVRLKSQDQDIFDAITTEHPHLTRDMLVTLEQIGLKKIHPMTLLMPSHVMNRVAEMPYVEQRYLAEQPIVEVAVTPRHGHRKLEIIQKRVDALTPREAKVVLAPDGPRTPREQVAITARPPPLPVAKSLGLFALTYMNGRLWVRQAKRNCKVPQRVILENNQALIELFQ